MERKNLTDAKKKILYSTWFRVELYYSLPQNYEMQMSKSRNEFFGESSGRDVQELLKDRDKFCSTPYAHLLAIENNNVIGANSLFKREINYNGEKIILGGFGGLFTIREKRKKGVATILLKIGMEELKRLNCDIAFLCTDVENPDMVKLYSQFGFVLLGKSYTFLGKSGTRYTKFDGMIAPVKSKNKFNYILEGKTSLDIGTGNW